MAVRKKAYSRVRLLAWTLELEKNEIVFCPNRNCQFMAFDIDDIIKHNQLCRGENTEDLFYCSICKKGTYEKYKTDNHILHKHFEEAIKLGIEIYTFPVRQSVASQVCKKSWDLMLENKGYIKCFRLFCNFVTCSEKEMETHFTFGCVPVRCQVFYTCLTCKGNMKAGQFLLQHANRCSTKTYELIDQNVINSLNKQLSSKNYAKCITVGCNYISHDINKIINHYKKCLFPAKEKKYEVCKQCGGWLDKQELNQHLQISHLARLQCVRAVQKLMSEENGAIQSTMLFCDENEILETESWELDEVPVRSKMLPNYQKLFKVNFSGKSYKGKRKRKLFFEPTNVKIAKFTNHLDCKEFDYEKLELPESPKFDYDIESILNSFDFNYEFESVFEIKENDNLLVNIPRCESNKTKLQILGSQILKESKGMETEKITLRVNNKPLVIKIPPMKVAIDTVIKEKNNFSLKQKLLECSRNAVELLKESRALVTTISKP